MQALENRLKGQKRDTNKLDRLNKHGLSEDFLKINIPHFYCAPKSIDTISMVVIQTGFKNKLFHELFEPIFSMFLVLLPCSV